MGGSEVLTVHAKVQRSFNRRVEHLLSLARMVLGKEIHGVENLGLHPLRSLLAIIIELLLNMFAQAVSRGCRTKVATDELNDSLEASGVLVLPIPASREQNWVARVEIEIVQVDQLLVIDPWRKLVTWWTLCGTGWKYKGV